MRGVTVFMTSGFRENGPGVCVWIGRMFSLRLMTAFMVISGPRIMSATFPPQPFSLVMSNRAYGARTTLFAALSVRESWPNGSSSPSM